MTKKFPRMPHLPWSPGGSNDDKRLQSADHFLSVPIVITEKMDGSNLCLTREFIYARSHSGPPTHKSFDLAKALHASISHNIPRGISIFGEWVACLHSIKYIYLPNYFLVFHIRNDINNKWMSWDFVKQTSLSLGLSTVPELFFGIIKNGDELYDISNKYANGLSQFGIEEKEGIVIRPYETFDNEEFHTHNAKWVRYGILNNTTQHWMKNPIIYQQLSKTSLFFDLIKS